MKNKNSIKNTGYCKQATYKRKYNDKKKGDLKKKKGDWYCEDTNIREDNDLTNCHYNSNKKRGSKCLRRVYLNPVVKSSTKSSHSRKSSNKSSHSKKSPRESTSSRGSNKNKGISKEILNKKGFTFLKDCKKENPPHCTISKLTEHYKGPTDTLDNKHWHTLINDKGGNSFYHALLRSLKGNIEADDPKYISSVIDLRSKILKATRLILDRNTQKIPLEMVDYVHSKYGDNELKLKIKNMERDIETVKKGKSLANLPSELDHIVASTLFNICIAKWKSWQNRWVLYHPKWGNGGPKFNYGTGMRPSKSGKGAVDIELDSTNKENGCQNIMFICSGRINQCNTLIPKLNISNTPSSNKSDVEDVNTGELNITYRKVGTTISTSAIEKYEKFASKGNQSNLLPWDKNSKKKTMLEDTIILWDNKTILATLTFKKKSEEEIAIHKFLAREGKENVILLNFFVLMLRTFKDIEHISLSTEKEKDFFIKYGFEFYEYSNAYIDKDMIEIIIQEDVRYDSEGNIIKGDVLDHQFLPPIDL